MSSITKTEDGRIILYFGYGDIIIAPCAPTAEQEADHVAIGTIDGGKVFPIDVVIDEVRGRVMDDWAVRMYFEKVESLDSLIHVLQDFRKVRFGETNP